ncbi:conserved hypothetical protein [Candida dubliniensis CD36]|uniref:Uncharacterized protein n=1 Tax=Candida dubliniensis (strain CD36 / ATCC MYA-646 / CBS 7987 / NCPF 3949 / NRRL Y-17841) TaxID=573826 RepID=B9WMT1_CANDC|nr:conserved hypothetical protein [Candida dubliniensis CD36]CAX40397.1 conserved hypothetical protein [Candida dubliniensis CD36]
MFLVPQHEKDEIQNTALKYIRLQLMHDLLLRKLSYGHINYDIDDLNEVRKSAYTKYLLMNNVETCCIIKPIQMYTDTVAQNQQIIQINPSTCNRNLLNANYHANRVAKIEYIVKYQLFDYRIIRVGPEVKTTEPSLKERLKRIIMRIKNTFHRPIPPISKRMQEKSSKEFKMAHRRFLSHELQQIKAVTSPTSHPPSLI